MHVLERKEDRKGERKKERKKKKRVVHTQMRDSFE
jgi:hypothetical protein